MRPLFQSCQSSNDRIPPILRPVKTGTPTNALQDATPPRATPSRPPFDRRDARHLVCQPGRDARGGGRADRRLCAGGDGAATAVARRVDRLSSESAAAGLHRRPRADRRIRRRAAQHRALPGHSRPDEEGGARDRRLSLLRAWRRRLPRHSARRFCRPRARRRLAGREHDHDAGGAQLLPVERKDLYAQDLRNAARVQDRARADQGPDSRAVHEPDLSGRARVRFRRGRARVLRQGSERHHAGRSRDAGRLAEGAVRV